MSEEAIVPQRLVIVVPTDAVHDSRTLRIAMSLRGRGHRVTIVARQTSSAAALETGPTGIELIRVACDPIDGLPLPAGLRHALRRAVGVRRPTSRAEPASEAPHGRGRMIEAIRQATRFLAIGLTVRSQERSAALVDLGGDLYHGMAFQGIPVALGLARRARSRGIYDIRDIYLDSRNLARLPGPARRVLQGLEARWVRDATATITVNESCAEVIEHRYGIRPVVVMNCPPRADDDGPPRQLVRDAVGLTAADPVVLYHGGLLAGRGLARTIEALADRRLARAHLVFMGWGEEEAHLRQLARGPEVNGRIHFLPPVGPAEVVEWVASADVSVMINEPVTLNERLSTPNKLFESLAAGTPVVSSDFPERRRIVMEDPLGPLGAVCDPTDTSGVAAALGSILMLDDDARADLRGRCAAAARERYTWEAQLPVLLATYRRVTGRAW